MEVFEVSDHPLWMVSSVKTHKVGNSMINYWTTFETPSKHLWRHPDGPFKYSWISIEICLQHTWNSLETPWNPLTNTWDNLKGLIKHLTLETHLKDPYPWNILKSTLKNPRNAPLKETWNSLWITWNALEAPLKFWEIHETSLKHTWNLLETPLKQP